MRVKTVSMMTSLL